MDKARIMKVLTTIECAANTLKSLYESSVDFPDYLHGCNENILILLKSSIEEFENGTRE